MLCCAAEHEKQYARLRHRIVVCTGEGRAEGVISHGAHLDTSGKGTLANISHVCVQKELLTVFIAHVLFQVKSLSSTTHCPI